MFFMFFLLFCSACMANVAPWRRNRENPQATYKKSDTLYVTLLCLEEGNARNFDAKFDNLPATNSPS
jgi:hypothetical protein